MRLSGRLYITGLPIRNLAVLALVGSGIGAIVFDWDHLLAWFLGIENGRFLHHPQAVLLLLLLCFCGWRIKQLVSRLYRRLK